MAFGLEKLDDRECFWFLKSGDTSAKEKATDVVERGLSPRENGEVTWAVGEIMLGGPRGSRVYRPTSTP